MRRVNRSLLTSTWSQCALIAVGAIRMVISELKTESDGAPHGQSHVAEVLVACAECVDLVAGDAVPVACSLH
jgi:hypothetical protein